MRAVLATLAACALLWSGGAVVLAPTATARGHRTVRSDPVFRGAGAARAHTVRREPTRAARTAHSPPALTGLRRYLRSQMRAAGLYSGADVVDLTTHRTLFSERAATPRLPASVQKLYTTSTALLEFGPTATLQTSVLGVGSLVDGTFIGTLYLRGGGDPTFGSAPFDRLSYGTGATVQALAAELVDTTGLRALEGNVVADESYFDSLRGTPATGYRPNLYVEGELSALAFDRGWANPYGSAFFAHPARTAGAELVSALRAAGVQIPAGTRVLTGRTPPGATPLAAAASPPMSTLIALTNAPSDNFFAEMLLKGIGARFGAGGTTAGGAAVVRAQVASRFGLRPRFDDGSGLSRYDRTTPRDVVSLLRQMASDPYFTGSLAVAGRTGTLEHEMQGTYAQGRCRGKTGTLSDVSNLVGYCHARDGHTLAFALMMNGIYPYYAHPIQDRMVVALARYRG